MNSIKVTILGKQYPLRVQEGEEDQMAEIAAFVDERFRLFKRELASQPEHTIMVLASLSIAEELYAEKRKPVDSGDTDEALSTINAKIYQLLDDIKSGNSHI